jgi:hypothetical protein
VHSDASVALYFWQLPKPEDSDYSANIPQHLDVHLIAASKIPPTV